MGRLERLGPGNQEVHVKDLRGVLEEMASRSPEEILHVQKPVDPYLEATAIIARLEREHRFPTLIFENILGSDFPAVCNVMAERRRVAWFLGVEEEELLETIASREAERIAPRRVMDGPVREVILKGDDIDIRRFPVFTHNDADDAGIAVSRDPVSRRVDLGIFRNRLIDESHIGLYYSWGKQIQFLHQQAEKRGQPLPVAIVLGAHPALYLASQGLASVATGDDEYEVASGLLGEPINLVRCETVDLEVPADAEGAAG